jgi:DNA-binding IclR family transcriptional regulator
MLAAPIGRRETREKRVPEPRNPSGEPSGDESDLHRGQRSAAGERVRSLGRGLDVLELAFDRRDPLTVKDITRALRVPRSSAYDIVTLLARRGYLTADGCGFALGRQLHRLGLGHESRSVLLRDARPVIAALRDETGEIVQLSVLDHDANLVVLREEGHGRINIVFPVGTHAPVNWSASGCLLVSDLSDDELRNRLPGTLKPSPTGRAPTAIDEVIRDIRRFRAQGHAVKRGHVHAHVTMVAVPVIDSAGRCAAAITVVAYEVGLTERRVQALTRAARQAALALSRRLGAAR